MSFPFTWNFAADPLPQPLDNTDLVDYFNGSFIDGSRYINPITMDYELQENGCYVGMDATDQRVYMALFTTFNDSVVPNFGNNLTSMKMVLPNTNNQATLLVNQCLSPMVIDGSITIISIQVSTFQSQLNILINYQNNISGQQVKQNFVPNGAL